MSDERVSVRVSFTLLVDPDGWMDEYGVSSGEVREDVRAYFRNLVEGSYVVGVGIVAVG